MNAEWKVQCFLDCTRGLHDAMEIEPVESALVAIQIALASGREAGSLGDEVGDRLGLYLPQSQIENPVVAV